MNNLAKHVYFALAGTLIAMSLAGCGGDSGAPFTSKDNVKPSLSGPPAAAPTSTSTAPTFPGPRNNYTITRTATGYTVTDIVGSAGSVNLVNQVSARFSDFTVNLMVGEKSKTISASNLKLLLELYVAFFNRVPDADGMAYWIDEIKNGMTMDQLAGNFYIAAIQFTTLTGYSATMSNSDFVKIIYANVLGRSGATAPPVADVNYWADQLNSGKSTKGALIATMLNSAHTFAGDPVWGWVPQLLDNKLSVGQFFAIEQGLNYTTPEESISKTMAIVKKITFNDASAAKALINMQDQQFNQTIAFTPIYAVQSDGQARTLEVNSDLSIAASCYISTSDFTTLAGQITTNSDNCGKFIGYTDAANSTYSIGRFEYAQDLSPNVSIEVSQKKILGNINRPVEVYFLGGAFGWAFDGTQAFYYLYESETHWTGWIPSTQFIPSDFNKVSIHQTGRSIIVYVNGNELDRFELENEVTAKRVSIFFKGDPSVKESMQFDEFLVLDRSSNAETVSLMDASSIDALEFTGSTSSIVASDSLALGTLSDKDNPPVRKLSITNSGSTMLPPPQIVGMTNQGSSQVAYGGSNTCSNIRELQAGKSCSVFLRVPSDEVSTAFLSTPTQLKVAVTSGNDMKVLAVKVQASPAAPTPKITDITPNVVNSGTKQLFTIVGTNLPSTIALSIPNSTCENTLKPATNKVYCTISASSNGRVYVMSNNSATAKQLAARVITINVPSPYKKPLDSSYLISSNVALEFGSKNIALGKFHTGVDIMTKSKNPTVYAIADGTVVYKTTSSSKYTTNYLKYFNAFVVVKHGNFYAYYGHLDSNIREGSTIKAGDPIGTIRDAYNSDNTKNTSLNHLHLSISVGSSAQTSGWGYQATKELATALYINPMKYTGM